MFKDSELVEKNLETLAETEEEGSASVSASADKETGKAEGGNFRVNMNVVVRVRPLQTHERRVGSRGNLQAVKVDDEKTLVFNHNN